jgi:hypothetical protein
MKNEMVLWEANEPAKIPAALTDPVAIAAFAKQLNKRDIAQVTQAMAAGSFEMVCTFVWTRSMAALKRQLAFLGLDFIGQMLGRAEIDTASSLERVITDYEAIRLAEDLGLVTTTSAMRLRHLNETLSHFAQSGADSDDDAEEMTQVDAVTCLRTCVQSILARPQTDVAVKFAEFRRRLETVTLTDTDDDVQKLALSPYFYQRTTLNVLLALTRTASGAALDHALANTNVIIPLIWQRLRSPEKWKTGQTYAELHAAGKRAAASGLKRALLRVRGFDFVPENLRSMTFISAAKKVLEAHDGWQNFYNEPAPTAQLASLGTAIPSPALHVCVTAALSVYLGNFYGHSYDAEPFARTILDGISKERWEYFVNECLLVDNRILYKLTDTKPAQRWVELVRARQLSQLKVTNQKLRKLIQSEKASQILPIATGLIEDMGYKSEK